MRRSRITALALLACGLAATQLQGGEAPDSYRGSCWLGSASAAPGDSARISFFINSNPGTQAFQWSVDFDEEVLEGESNVDRVFQIPDGSEWGFAAATANNANVTPGNAGVDEGFFAGAVVWSFTALVSLPVDVDTEVLAFRVRVKPDAEAGSTDIQFLNGGRWGGNDWGVDNNLTLGGLGVSPDTRITPILINTRLQIVPDISIFVRGDSNDDNSVDIADVRATLNYLFQAADDLPCLDAADANDDGKLNVTDPITTLQFLFLGGRPLPAPSGTQGEDPTSDALDCAR